MKILNRFLPHNIISLRGLQLFFRVVLYALVLVFIYSLYNTLAVFLTPASELASYSAPLKKIWLTVLTQEVLLFIVLSVLHAACGALDAVQKRDLVRKD